MAELKISCLEKALPEVLNDVPGKVSFEHADQLMQGMTALSSRALQSLLEHCNNIKVKRLFLWFGSRHNHSWFSKFIVEDIYLRSGNPMIVKGSVLDKTYKITVPKDL